MKSEKVEWSILIATIGERREKFIKLIEKLLPQVEQYKGRVEILAYWNNFEKPLSEIRQALVEEARGEYISFIDDDDMVPDFYCSEIITAIHYNPDYVGWQMQLFENGDKANKSTYHSLKYDRWYEDDGGWYRNISHLNPIKKEIALKVPFDAPKGTAEDEAWAAKVFPLCKTEEYIDKVMYFYQYTRNDSTWQRRWRPGEVYYRTIIDSDCFRYHPDSESSYLGYLK